MTQMLKLIFRSLMKGRLYTLISLLGMAVAFTVVMLVAGLIQHELSYDRQFSDHEHIYRMTWQNLGTGDRFATMHNPSSPQVAIELDSVETATRIGTFPQLIGTGDSDHATVGIESLAFVDLDFFTIFDYPFTNGDPNDALKAPNSVVITQAAAEKYFPGENPIGQVLLLERSIQLTVTGIIEEQYETSHFGFHFILPFDTLRTLFNGAQFLDSWGSDAVHHYIKTKPNIDLTQLKADVSRVVESHTPYEDTEINYDLQPLTRIHFTPDLQNEMPIQDSLLNIVKAPRQYSDLWLFFYGALVMVLVASFNFMNLQVARGVSRGKQMGVLKVLGADRKAVIRYILLESTLLSILALCIALLLIELILPGFNQMLAVQLTWAGILTPTLIVIMLLLSLGLGLLSGSYPALLMASQSASQVMKGEFKLGQGASKIRQALVLLQFAVSVILIAVSLGIYYQVQYSISRPLGFNPSNTVVMSFSRPETRGQYPTIRERLLAHPDIEYVSRGSIIPTGSLSDGSELYPEGSNPDQAVALRRVGVDYDYFETFGIQMAAGRPFSRDFSGDIFAFPGPDNPVSEGGIILNETAARRAGWSNPQDAIGKVMRNEFNMGETQVSIIMQVVGVTSDVHFRSLRSEIVPMVYFLQESGRTMAVRINNDDTQAAAAHIQSVWNEVIPSLPLNMNWLEQFVSQQYARETRSLKLMASIAILAVAIAAMGLFAVAYLVTGFRIRELGLRKVLGAKVSDIVKLLSWQFLKPVLLANLIAWPVAWLLISDWLQSFVYRIDLKPWLFLAPAVIALLVAWITVAGHTWVVARRSPINALRHE